MQLKYDEMANFLKAWNAWYLIEHDSYLKSEFSENGVRIRIYPFDPKKIPENIIEDLRDYTDHLEIDEPDEFAINFFFPAWEHQPTEIIDALKPVFEIAGGANIEIKNFMNFLEENIPDAEDVNRPNGPPGVEETNNKKEEDFPAGAELGEQKGDEKRSGLRNEVMAKGVLSLENEGVIEGIEILHNGLPIPDIQLFLEAARLYETIEKDFKPPKGVADASPYQCADEKEAIEVNNILALTTDFRVRLTRGAFLDTSAHPEELAAAVIYARYKDRLRLFENPYVDHLREKRSEATAAARESLRKSCSCMMIGIIAAMALLFWWLSHRGGK